MFACVCICHHPRTYLPRKLEQTFVYQWVLQACCISRVRTNAFLQIMSLAHFKNQGSVRNILSRLPSFRNRPSCHDLIRGETILRRHWDTFTPARRIEEPFGQLGAIASLECRQRASGLVIAMEPVVSRLFLGPMWWSSGTTCRWLWGSLASKP